MSQLEAIMIMIIGLHKLDEHTVLAKASPRLRMKPDLNLTSRSERVEAKEMYRWLRVERKGRMFIG